jgi:hypothetical protein
MTVPEEEMAGLLTGLPVFPAKGWFNRAKIPIAVKKISFFILIILFVYKCIINIFHGCRDFLPETNPANHPKQCS